MSDEEKSVGETAAEVESDVEPTADEHTTAPNPSNQAASAASAKWQMPKPVFQKTSGYLPQGYLKDVGDPAGSSASDSAPGEAGPASEPKPKAEPDLSAINLAAPAVDVEPQPDLSEQLIPEEPEFETTRETGAKNTGLGTSFVVLGLVALMLFVAIFLTAVYFLFFAGSGEINNF